MNAVSKGRFPTPHTSLANFDTSRLTRPHSRQRRDKPGGFAVSPSPMTDTPSATPSITFARRAARLPLLLTVILMSTPPAATIARAGSHDGLAVAVTNGSEPVLCAEKDNVSIEFTSPEVRGFRIEAAHPAYITSIQRDSFEADWTDCDMSGDPVHHSGVQVTTRKTIYEEPDIWLVGWTFPTFWRPSTATVRIGDRVEKGLHMVQVWVIRPMGGEEVLVFYPQDGYWRMRPRAPAGLAPTAFGSSLLIGPHRSRRPPDRPHPRDRVRSQGAHVHAAL